MLDFNQQKNSLQKLIKYSWRKFIPDGQVVTVRDLLIDAYAANAVLDRRVNTINTNAATAGIFGRVFGYLSTLNTTNAPKPITLDISEQIQELGTLTVFWGLNYQVGTTISQRFITALRSNHQVAILNARELYRVRKLYPLFEVDPQTNTLRLETNNDDLAVALFLCGQFCRRNARDDYTPSFSGMLQENQQYNMLQFRVHTCLHGFIDEFGNLPGNEEPVEIYFIPYGRSLSDKNAFKVSRVYGSIRDATIAANAFDATLSKNYCYRNSDYACVTINGTSEGGQRLENILKKRKRPTNSFLRKVSDWFNNRFLFDIDFRLTTLPSLSGNANADADFNGFNHDITDDALRYYTTIGVPGIAELADGSGFAIAPSIGALNLPNQNEGQIQAMNDEYQFIIPPELPPRPSLPALLPAPAGRIAQERPSYPGMSGGPVLMTIHDRLRNTRRCRLLGTVWGAERTFNSVDVTNAQTTDMVAFTNTVVP